ADSDGRAEPVSHLHAGSATNGETLPNRYADATSGGLGCLAHRRRVARSPHTAHGARTSEGLAPTSALCRRWKCLGVSIAFQRAWRAARCSRAGRWWDGSTPREGATPLSMALWRVSPTEVRRASVVYLRVRVSRELRNANARWPRHVALPEHARLQSHRR